VWSSNQKTVVPEVEDNINMTGHIKKKKERKPLGSINQE
jgi:hypothetical protein